MCYVPYLVGPGFNNRPPSFLVQVKRLSVNTGKHDPLLIPCSYQRANWAHKPSFVSRKLVSFPIVFSLLQSHTSTNESCRTLLFFFVAGTPDRFWATFARQVRTFPRGRKDIQYANRAVALPVSNGHCSSFVASRLHAARGDEVSKLLQFPHA